MVLVVGYNTVCNITISKSKSPLEMEEVQKNVLSLVHRGEHRLNMELDLQSLFELLCTAVLID